MLLLVVVNIQYFFYKRKERERESPVYLFILFTIAFYLGALTYLAAPAFGATIDTASIIASAAAAPVALKVIAKATIATPFVFHSLNGIRHLVRYYNAILFLYVFVFTSFF